LITGPEGAGKTTVLRAILGLAATGGEVTVLGGDPGDAAVRRRVGYAPQGRAFTEGHSPRALVALVARLRTGRADAAVVTGALETAGVPEGRRGSRALDVEECRRVALACAVLGDPDLLVLDDPWEFPETGRAIEAARARGAAVVAATHDPGGLPDLLGDVLTLDTGRPAP
jgi:ABC-2 type transport system ATP-binding protein